MQIASAQKPREASDADAATPSPLQSSAWGKSGQLVPRWNHLDNFHKRYNKVCRFHASPPTSTYPSYLVYGTTLSHGGGQDYMLSHVFVGGKNKTLNNLSFKRIGRYMMKGWQCRCNLLRVTAVVRLHCTAREQFRALPGTYYSWSSLTLDPNLAPTRANQWRRPQRELRSF